MRGRCRKMLESPQPPITRAPLRGGAEGVDTSTSRLATHSQLASRLSQILGLALVILCVLKPHVPGILQGRLSSTGLQVGVPPRRPPDGRSPQPTLEPCPPYPDARPRAAAGTVQSFPRVRTLEDLADLVDLYLACARSRPRAPPALPLTASLPPLFPPFVSLPAPPRLHPRAYPCSERNRSPRWCVSCSTFCRVLVRSRPGCPSLTSRARDCRCVLCLSLHMSPGARPDAHKSYAFFLSTVSTYWILRLCLICSFIVLIPPSIFLSASLCTSTPPPPFIPS